MYVTVEGDLDAAVIRRIASAHGFPLTRLDAEGGRGAVESKIPKILEAALHLDWFVLVDLDSDECPVDLRSSWSIPDGHRLLFRIAVRSIESWLMADAKRFAEYISVARDLIPTDPESLLRPKDVLISLARRSRRREIREGLVPREGAGRKQGPLYTSLLSEFVQTAWRPEVARSSAPSLDRCLTSLMMRFRSGG